MRHNTSHRLAILSAALLTLATACSTNGPSSSPSGPLATTATTNPATAETPTVDSPIDTAGTSPAVSGDICATVPSLEVINAQLDEPVLRLARLERGPVTELCEAAGDGIASVSFSRTSQSNEQQMRELAAQLGYEVSEVGDPALPGAFTYAGAVTVFIGDVEFTVQAITLDTISDPASAVAIQRSSALLAAWLQRVGV